MTYELNGKKYLFLINVDEYDKLKNREGSQHDVENLIETFKNRV